jgi:hypothetical protein
MKITSVVVAMVVDTPNHSEVVGTVEVVLEVSRRISVAEKRNSKEKVVVHLNKIMAVLKIIMAGVVGDQIFEFQNI